MTEIYPPGHVQQDTHPGMYNRDTHPGSIDGGIHPGSIDGGIPRVLHRVGIPGCYIEWVYQGVT